MLIGPESCSPYAWLSLHAATYVTNYQRGDELCPLGKLMLHFPRILTCLEDMQPMRSITIVCVTLSSPMKTISLSLTLTTLIFTRMAHQSMCRTTLHHPLRRASHVPSGRKWDSNCSVSRRCANNTDLLNASTTVSTAARLHARFDTSANIQEIPADEYRKLLRQLNAKQRVIVMFHCDWYKTALKQGEPINT